MVVLGVMPVPGCGRGPLGKASEGKANRWFANLLLGKKKKSLTLKKALINRALKKSHYSPAGAFWFFFGGGGGVEARLFYDPILPRLCFWEVLL